jgi:hypothetical protein
VDALADGLEFVDDDAHELDDGLFAGDRRPSGAASPSGPASPTGTVGIGPAIAGAAPIVAASPGLTAEASSSPGAYVPPVLQPAGSIAPARAWAGHASDEGTNGLDGRPAGAAGPAVDAAGTDSKEVKSSLIDAAAAAEFVGWLAIAGASLATAGFLLPWSVSVIGASGVGYFDRWGFAGPGHILMVAGLLGVLAAAILRDRVPMWLGIGLPGLGLGALLIGLVWPYVVGPLGAQLGALAVGLGAVMLVVAGIVALIVDRHGRERQVV